MSKEVPAVSDMDYNITVLGAGGVGKSSLTIRLITDKFMEDYDPTIEDSYSKTLDVDGEAAHINILDTAGQDEYSGLAENWMRQGDGFVLVYSITSTASFEKLSQLYNLLLRAKDTQKVPLVIVGNKCDLEHQRAVKKSEAEALAASWGCKWLETSAKSSINNSEVFIECVREMRKMRQKKPGKKDRKPLCTIL
jgi:small GTP-binding protein